MLSKAEMRELRFRDAMIPAGAGAARNSRIAIGKKAGAVPHQRRVGRIRGDVERGIVERNKNSTKAFGS